MSKPKRRVRVTATQGLVEGIMQAVSTYNAEMGLEAPRMPLDGPTTSDPIERPARRRTTNRTGQTGA
jgi:hypothetical protein